LVARRADQGARLADDILVAEQPADAALQDIAVLVLACVPVQRRCEGARAHRMLNQREAPAGLAAVDHEPDADAPQETQAPVRGPQYPCRRCLHRRASFFYRTLLSREIYREPARSVKIERTPMTHDMSNRPYRMKLRAELQERTRRRITESALELHGTLGPSRTSMSAVAEHAGVRRSTLYRHFPDEAALFVACT